MQHSDLKIFIMTHQHTEQEIISPRPKKTRYPHGTLKTHVTSLPYLLDHKVPLIFSKIESAPYNVVRLMYESGCAFSSRTNFMW